MGFDAGACAWERSWKNNGAGESQGIGSVRLGGINVDPIMAGERCSVKPCAVCKERITAEMRNRGFQMQAAGDGNADDLIVVRGANGGELADAFGVAALGETDKKLAADTKDIATFESAGKRNVFELSKLGERLGERRGLAAAGLRSER